MWEKIGFRPFLVNDTLAKFDASNPDVLEEIRMVIMTESEFLSDILDHIQSNDVFYDIGAHVGTHASFAASTITDGTVLAFEPVSKNVYYLKRNLDLNRANAQVYPIAITDKYGSSQFAQPENKPEQSGPLGSIAPEQGEYSVETAPMDDFIIDEDLPKPNIVKIDVEGAEPLVLEGMENTLGSISCRILFLEVHLPTPHIDRPSINVFESSVIEIMNYLREFGFTVEVTNSRAWVLHLKAQKD